MTFDSIFPGWNKSRDYCTTSLVANLTLIDSKHEIETSCVDCRTKLDSKSEGCEEDVTLRLAEMIYCSHKFDNELSHERGIGKVFDTIFERQANILASLFCV